MEVKNSHGLPDNICNTPKLATIELHHNKYGTGEYFATYITWVGRDTDGFWIDKQLTKEELDTILSICCGGE